MENSFADYRINDMQSKIANPPFNIAFVGVTGAGKSSTINALLGTNAAKIGYGTDPETQKIQCYRLNDYMQFWDTPGLGDSPEKDARHLKRIKALLCRARKEKGVKCGKLIDMVVVVIDGSRRDLGEVYTLLKEAVFPYIKSFRVLFIINQADMAKSGRHWNGNESAPDEVLSDFLQKQAKGVKERIAENTGEKIRMPICCSATEGFNIKRIIDHILDKLPAQRSHYPTDEEIVDNARIKIGTCSVCGKAITFTKAKIDGNPTIRNVTAHSRCRNNKQKVGFYPPRSQTVQKSYSEDDDDDDWTFFDEVGYQINNFIWNVFGV